LVAGEHPGCCGRFAFPYPAQPVQQPVPPAVQQYCADKIHLPLPAVASLAPARFLACSIYQTTAMMIVKRSAMDIQPRLSVCSFAADTTSIARLRKMPMQTSFTSRIVELARPYCIIAFAWVIFTG